MSVHKKTCPSDLSNNYEPIWTVLLSAGLSNAGSVNLCEFFIADKAAVSHMKQLGILF